MPPCLVGSTSLFKLGEIIYMKRMIANIKDSPTGIKVPGDLIVDGTITPNQYELDEDITMPAFVNVTDGVTGNFYYAHARVSNGKLSIVLALSLIPTDTSVDHVLSKTYNYASTLYLLPLPSDVLAKLHPINATTKQIAGQTLYCNNIYTDDAQYPANGVQAGAIVWKNEQGGGIGIAVSVANGTIPAGTLGLNARFEFNFILS
jgi:hypothetical protein